MQSEASGLSLFTPCPLAEDLTITYISTHTKRKGGKGCCQGLQGCGIIIIIISSHSHDGLRSGARHRIEASFHSQLSSLGKRKISREIISYVEALLTLCVKPLLEQKIIPLVLDHSVVTFYIYL